MVCHCTPVSPKTTLLLSVAWLDLQLNNASRQEPHEGILALLMQREGGRTLLGVACPPTRAVHIAGCAAGTHEGTELTCLGEVLEGEYDTCSWLHDDGALSVVLGGRRDGQCEVRIMGFHDRTLRSGAVCTHSAEASGPVTVSVRTLVTGSTRIPAALVAVRSDSAYEAAVYGVVEREKAEGIVPLSSLQKQSFTAIDWGEGTALPVCGNEHGEVCAVSGEGLVRLAVSATTQCLLGAPVTGVAADSRSVIWAAKGVVASVALTPADACTVCAKAALSGDTLPNTFCTCSGSEGTFAPLVWFCSEDGSPLCIFVGTDIPQCLCPSASLPHGMCFSFLIYTPETDFEHYEQLFITPLQVSANAVSSPPHCRCAMQQGFRTVWLLQPSFYHIQTPQERTQP